MVKQSNTGLVSLKQYIDKEIDWLQKILQSFKNEVKDNVNLASKEIEYRLDELNNLRREVVQDRDVYLRKDVYENKHEALENRVSRVEQWQNRAIGVVTVLLFLAGIVGAVIGNLLS